MPRQLVNTLDGGNRENYRDLLLHIPSEKWDLEHKQNKETNKECDRNHQDNTDGVG
jgi:hypothetical protein